MTDFLDYKMSYAIAHYLISMMTLHDVPVDLNLNHRSMSRESENFSKSRQFYYQNFPCDLIKKMNTHALGFCPLIRKL